jgi:hypothetical protein
MDPTQFKYVVPYFNSKEIDQLEQEHIGFTENYRSLGIPKRNTWKGDGKNKQINRPVEEVKEMKTKNVRMNKTVKSSFDKISRIDEQEIDEDGNPSEMLINEDENNNDGVDELINSQNVQTFSVSNSFDL